nr:hypothetical protein [Chitinophagaceae bacterium]
MRLPSSCLALFLLVSISFRFLPAQAAPDTLRLHHGWQFRQAGSTMWRTATVPGTVHTDLMQHGLIGDPFTGNNEKAVQWVGEADWEYRTRFSLSAAQLQARHLQLVFEGLDTYAEVWLNGRMVLQANNMFRQWRINLKPWAKAENQLEIRFRPARRVVDSLARANRPLVVPDHNRAYARKAQYHFGWDWGPTLITAGIWRSVFMEAGDEPAPPPPAYTGRKVELVQEPDSIGRAFYFRIDGQPVYMKGANYIPSDVFLPRLQYADYERIIKQAKEANMNMLRIWGGGVYEHEAFYELCDKYGIMVWQDFMFAGAMVPDDEAFFANVREEVKHQIERLRKYKCIVVWCGNNEVDEAWHNWGWQKQFNLQGEDSARLWKAYARLFRDSLPAWVERWDGTRPYVSTSPMHGWGRAKSFTEGDSHYWGVWWGLQDIEVFETKTGRFVSEYGMQAMPDITTTYSAIAPGERFLFSEALKTHQKHPTGYQNIQSYLHRYFLDSQRVKQLSLEDYTYLTQCLQHYSLKNIIAIHRSKYPVNMGTLLWQL